ncbi:type II toxin-antitoxin system VapC family toxin [Ornithinimicrobium cryptoxanthini]|uniref:type II toxin-antitoxin system VapC family toxin n=1 Tax=Ornithinimicrobium cryptoxanthini TaxID=2934161 RepID=UPI0021181857|nr:type II toxin-antitoxin system VapC family toxin [Ornithinimicrobium cryptoxanthini]
MSVVVDSSVLVDLLTGAAQPSLLGDAFEQEWHAPAHLDAEVVHALRGLVLGAHISAARAQDALTDLHELRLRRWPLELPLARRCLELAHNVSAYDAAFLTLAEVLDCPMLTRDARLARAADGLSGAQVQVV